MTFHASCRAAFRYDDAAMKTLRPAPVLSALSLAALLTAPPAPSATVWIEGESPEFSSLPHGVAGWGDASVLSDGKWLFANVEAGEVAAKVPAEGGVLRYRFETSDAAGPHDVWARIGYEFVRAEMEWRVDGGAWADNLPGRDFTQDLMALQDWCEVAWCRLGTADLAPGPHTLELRFPRRFEDEEKTKHRRILCGVDALAVAAAGAFRPNGPHRPGDAWRTADDRAAEAFRFALPEPPADGARAELPLAGRWQYARWDETAPVPSLRDLPAPPVLRTLPGGGAVHAAADGSPLSFRENPASALPAPDELHWGSVVVPGDRNARLPSEKFAHRFVYRTRVRVPEAYRGGSLVLDLERCNLLTSVFVNGTLVAASSAAASGFHADLSSAIRPGEDNELCLVFKDAYYAYEPQEAGADLRRWFNLPPGMLHNQGVSQRMDFPTCSSYWAGPLNDIRLLATPAPAYADDIYVIPSVSRRELAVEVTVPGGPDRPAEAVVSATVRPVGGGAAALQLPAERVALPRGAGADATATLRAPWADARLWSPEDPFLYECVVTVEAGGRRDVSVQSFGFREWRVEGTSLTLNGVPWQMRATTDWMGCSAADVPRALADWKARGQSMFRMMHQNDWGGVSREKAFDIFDRAGVPVRTEAGLFDGQMALYGLVENGPDGRSSYRRALFEHLYDQWRAGMRRYRNHPCIFAWVTDNEILFINSRNFGTLDAVEPGFRKLHELIREMDRQGRPAMTEGGRALKDQSMPVNGCHYEMLEPRRYPDAAYSARESWPEPTREQPWPMDFSKPIFLNEEFYAAGNPVSYYAEVGGEGCFLGRADCREATALLGRMMSEGFRWQGLAGWHFWLNSPEAGGALAPAWQPTCALVRERTRTLAGGAPARRLVMVRNDNTFDASPITLEWSLSAKGAARPFASGRRELAVPCGGGATAELAWTTPAVKARTAASLTLRCLRDGKTVFEETRPLAILPAAPAALPSGAANVPVAYIGAETDAAFRRLRALGLKPRAAATPGDAFAQKPAPRLVVAGPGTLAPRDATDPRWLAFAAAGGRAIVLEQGETLHFQAVPADISATAHSGAIAFPQNPAHAVFRGLAPGDLAFWAGGGHAVYTNAFAQPTRGADALVQCGPALGDCALAQCTPGDGLLLLSQLLVGTKLAAEPAAAILFDNLVRHALAYRPLRRPATAWLPEGDPRLDALAATGLQFTRAASAAEALDAAPGGIVLFDATRAKLDALLALGRPRLDAFFRAGGWLVPWNVDADSLASFNALVGANHRLRPFRREKVEIAVPRDPLLSGLSQRDVTLFSSERIFGWTSDCFVADDVFNAVVDTGDIAPFASGFGIPGPGRERKSQSAVNGFLSAEAWRYIVYHEYPADAAALPSFTWSLPRRERVRQVSIAPNGHYRGLHDIEILFDDDPATARRFSFGTYPRDGGPRTDFDIEPPVEAGRVTVHALDLPEIGGDRNITGIDNLWIAVERDPARTGGAVPLLNVGGLVKYPRGTGGLLLCQLLVKPSEEVPENAPKKRGVLAALLRNLGGVFAAAREIRPYDRADWRPVSFEGVANLYLDAAHGFPAQGGDDLAAVPVGDQRMAGVLFHIRDFRTSPLESAATLRGMAGASASAPDALEIPVGGTADALFFLHTLHPSGATWQGRDTDTPPALWEYEIRYEDGQSAVFPVGFGRGCASWKDDGDGAGLAGAALAWSAPSRGEPGRTLRLYHARWTNPRPEAAIRSVVMRRGPDGERWGHPILLGITAASMR